MERLRQLFRISLLLSVLLTVTTEAWADNGAYAELSNNTLTFKYGPYTPSSTSCWAVSQSSWSSTDDVPWAASRTVIYYVIFDSSFSQFKPQSCANWFYGCNSLMSISDINNLDTSQTTDMSSMFYDCSSLVSLDLSSFNTSQVTNMGSMFYGCSSLESLDLSSFDTSQVTYMYYMFSRCSSLRELDFGSSATTNVTYFSGIFNQVNENLVFYYKDITKQYRIVSTIHSYFNFITTCE